MKEHQFKRVDHLDCQTNTEPVEVTQPLDPHITHVHKLQVAATNDGRGAHRKHVDLRGVAAEVENIVMSHPREQGCRLGCSCVCHAHHHLQSPFFFDGLIGSLYVRYSGFATTKNRCNEYFCSKRSQSKAFVIYSFPQWLLGTYLQSHRSTSSYTNMTSLRVLGILSSGV